MITDKSLWNLVNQNPEKYALQLNTLFLLSHFNPLTVLLPGTAFGHGLAPAALPSYIWGRWNDDIADDHEKLPSGYASYEDLLEGQKKIIADGERNVIKDFNIEYLLKRVVLRLERAQRPGDNIRQDLTDFLDAMQTEYFRRVNKKVSTFQELSDLYAKSFGKPHNIMLIAFGSSNRESQITELSQIQGRMFNSEEQSLLEDLPKGICYIPSEVLSVSGLGIDELIQDPSLVETNPSIQQWQKEEIHDCAKLYSNLVSKIEALDWKTKLYIKGLTKNMEAVLTNPPQKINLRNVKRS
jgi:hypothetical protein